MVRETGVEIGKRCVIVDRTGSIVRVRELGITNISTVDLKLGLCLSGANEILSIIAVRAEELDGVVERKLLNSRIRLNGLLCLSDQHVLRSRGESRALVGIEVDELGVDLVRIAGERTTLTTRTPGNSDLDVMVLESHQGDGRLGILAKRESQGVNLSGVRPVIQGLMRLRVRLTEKKGSETLRKNGIVGINDLPPDQELNLGNFILPTFGGAVGRSITVGDVHVPEKVTLALETHGRHTVHDGVTLDNLLLDGLSKIRMALVGGTEKRNLGTANNVRILGSNSN